MPTVYFGTKDEPGFELEQSDDLIVVRTRSGRSIAKSAGPVADPLSAELEDGTLVAAYPEAGVEVKKTYDAATRRLCRKELQRHLDFAD